MQFRLSFIILILSFVSINEIDAQNFAKRYWDRLVNDTTDVTKPQLLVYPTLAFAPETSWEIGLSTLYVYHAKRDTVNRLSEFNAFTFFTLENQFGLWLDHAFYTDKNDWFFLGKLRLQSFPLLYHGIGIESPPDYLAQVNANQIIIEERVLRQVRKDFFVGAKLDYQRFFDVEFVDGTNGVGFPLPLGNEGSNSVGLGLGVVYDNRHNVLNVRKGFFSELALINYNDIWGSSYNFTSVLSDTRIYRPIGKRNVFAAQLLGEFNSGEIPFNQLALLGGESIMRGYYLGRFRDNNQIAAQVEYRFLPLPLGFTDRIGLALFAGAGNTFPDIESLQVNDFVIAGGAGLRFLLFPKKDIWTRLDVAFTNEDVGFYLFIGEAF